MNTMKTSTRLLALPFALALAAFVSLQDPVTRVIEPGHRHLGNDDTPEWPEAPAAPAGKRLDIEFKAKARSGDSVLWITQRSVDNVWRLKINDKDMGTLKTNNEPAYLILPALLCVLSVICGSYQVLMDQY